MTRVHCPGCGRAIDLTDDELAKTIECAKCEVQFRPVPEAASASAAAANDATGDTWAAAYSAAIWCCRATAAVVDAKYTDAMARAVENHFEAMRQAERHLRPMLARFAAEHPGIDPSAWPTDEATMAALMAQARLVRAAIREGLRASGYKGGFPAPTVVVRGALQAIADAVRRKVEGTELVFDALLARHAADKTARTRPPTP